MAGRWSRRYGGVMVIALFVVAACAPTAPQSGDSPGSSDGVDAVIPAESPSAGLLAAAVGDPTTVSAGGTHACEVVTGGTVRCWGRNNYGQLGHNSNINANTPFAVIGLSGVTKLSAGYTHTCAIVAAGAVKCWGANTYGQLGNNTVVSSKVAVTVSGVTGATAISAGYYHTCAIVAGGAVKCWGQNKSGQLGNNSIVNAKTAVSVTGITGATKLSASGVAHTCAVLAGGAIKCWGNNTYGQLGNNTKVSSRVPVSVFGTTGATAVSLGGYHSCVIVSGFAKCWGNNTYGQLGTASNTSSTNAATVAGISGATQISSFYRHTCALVSGAVKCWGYNLYGQLGVGNSTNTNAPVTMTGVSGATVLSAGANFTCAMVTGAVLKCTGQNSFGQLGNATFTTAASPVTVAGPPANSAPYAYYTNCDGTTARSPGAFSGDVTGASNPAGPAPYVLPQITKTVFTSVKDDDGDALSVSMLTPPTSGTASVTMFGGTDGSGTVSGTFTAAAGQTVPSMPATVTFVARLTDGRGGSVDITFYFSYALYSVTYSC